MRGTLEMPASPASWTPLSLTSLYTVPEMLVGCVNEKLLLLDEEFELLSVTPIAS